MKKALPLFVFISMLLSTTAQQAKWKANFETQKVFIENKAQFNELTKGNASPVLFATDNSNCQILFTKTGLAYRLQKTEKKEKEERENEKARSFAEREAEEHSMDVKTDKVNMQWLNANPNVQVIAEQPVSFYYTYSNKSRARAFQKLTYKNLYPNIDVEYVFHPKEGIEYSFILHPGADVSQIKMKYSDVSKVNTDESGNVHLRTIFGDIVDHAPLTAYSGQMGNSSIPTRFVLNGKTVSFKLDGYDNSLEAVIDPWTTTPTMPNANSVFYIKSDTLGNAYIYGGDNPFRLVKYDSTGVLKWTYNTPWSSGSHWFGALVADYHGNCYVTDGDGASLTKIDSTGAFVWSHSSANAPALAIEFWTMAFNCNQSELFVGGTRDVPFSFSFKGTIFKMDMTNGTISNYVNVYSPAFTGMPCTEVRSMCFAPDGNIHYLGLDSVGSISPALAIGYGRKSTYAFPYYLPYSNTGGGQGSNSICASMQYIYTTDGGNLHKRDINTGAVLATVAILGGSANNNSGVAVDSCGNVYVGSQTRVIKYDANLTYIASANTPEPVYDVSIARNGDVLACGHNFAVALNMGSCGQMVQGCFTVLTANANETDASCNQCNGTATANPITGSGPYSYLWSNGGTTQSINNLCAGPYTVTITDATSSQVTASASVAQTGGTGAVTLTAANTVICPGDSALICAPAGYTAYQWNNGATTQCIYAKLAGNYYTTVTANGGCTSTSNHVALNVHPQPPVSISVNGDTLTAYNSFSYQWYLNSNLVPGATSNVLIAHQNGNYQVAVTDTNGCTAFSNAVVVATGIAEFSQANGINVYPNPLGHGNWNLEVTSDMIGSIVELFDAEGRLIYRSEIHSLKSQIEVNAAKGVYLLKVSADRTSVSIKLTHL